jgi:MFS family permease
MADRPLPGPTRPGLWHHRDFRLLWGGQSVSELGSQVSTLALPLVAIDTLHAGTFAVALLSSFQTLPFLLVGLPAGAWADRMRRRPVLVAADIGRVVALGSVPVAWACSALTLGQLYAVSLVAGVLTVFFDVDYQSYLPSLLPPDQLIDGNGKLQATSSGAAIAGPALGGVLVGSLGAANAVAADAVSFVVSVLSLLGIRAPEVTPVRHTGADGRPTRLRAEIAEGLRFVWHEPRIRSVAFTTATSNLFTAVSGAIIVLYMRRTLHLGATHIGILIGAGSVGGLLGALVAARLGRRLGIGRAIIATCAVAGVGDLLYPLATRGNADVLIVAGEVLVGAGAVAYNINQVSVRQALCPPRLLGRMNASVRFMVWGTLPLGGVIGGALATAVGLRPTLWVAGIGSFFAFTWVLFSPVRHLVTLPSAPIGEPAPPAPR